jgi:hypothetical protein
VTPVRELRDIAASVRQRLLNLARESHLDFNRVLERYTVERFLYRLGVSAEVDRFTLKGAALFLIWTERELRPTRDVDLLGTGPEDPASLRAAIETVCSVNVAEDGLSFDPASIRITSIRDEQDYGGQRVRLRASLGKAMLPLQVDVGFGDVVTPERLEAAYPTLLDHPAPRLWTYPRETVVAEKFEAMLSLGSSNTRLRDFWDVAVLAQRFAFDGETLRTAIDATIRRRKTVLGPEIPDALRPAFYADAARARQWRAFLTKAGGTLDGPTQLDDVGERVREFLGPLRESLVRGEEFTRNWVPGGPWRVVQSGEEENEG